MDTSIERPSFAPTFRPTPQEFSDPLAYIKKISLTAFEYGICKIIPPEGWRSPFAVDRRNFTFVPRLQELSDVCAFNRVKCDFVTSFINYWEAQDVNVFIPQIKGKSVDIYRLWKLVKTNGGFQATCDKKLWGRLCNQLGLPASPSHASALSSHYKKYLLPYDIFCDRLKDSKVNTMLCSVCGLGNDDQFLLLCDGCETSGACHTYCLSPPLSDVPKGSWYCFHCITRRYQKLNRVEAFGFKTSPNKYTLHKFSIHADEFKTKHFGKPLHMISLEECEREFWRLIKSDDTEVCVEYGADLNAKLHGSGFPLKKPGRCKAADKFYAESPWNLNNLSVGARSALRFLPNDISGMIIPWCYVGMVFSCFCWHIEDHWSYSINYLHVGEPKTWYGVPTACADAFEAAMRAEVPELFDSYPDLLHHMTTMIAPSSIQKHGVPVYRLDQLAGEFVITFPRAFHAGFNQGFNFAEAVNFCPADWFEFGQHCVDHYAIIHRTPVFAHSELLCRMAVLNEPLSVDFLTVLTKQLGDLLTTERCLRRRVAQIGVRRTERMVFENSDDEKRECELCKTTLYLSSLACDCSTTMVCLAHYQIRTCCSRKDQVMRYRYGLDELTEFRDRIQNQFDDFKRWQSQVDLLMHKPMDSVENKHVPNHHDSHLNNDLTDHKEENMQDEMQKESDATLGQEIIHPTKQDQMNKLSLSEIKELLNIGQIRNYPDTSLDQLRHIIHTIEECSELIRQLLSSSSLDDKHVNKQDQDLKKNKTNSSFLSLNSDSEVSNSDDDADEDDSRHEPDPNKSDSSGYDDRGSTSPVKTNRLKSPSLKNNNKAVKQESSSPKRETLVSQIQSGCSTKSVRNKVGRCKLEDKWDTKGPVISKLTLEEFSSLIQLADGLPTVIPELDDLHKFAQKLSDWRQHTRELIDKLDQIPVTDSDLANDSIIFNTLPSASQIDDLMNFALSVNVEVRELKSLRRIHECLTWLEEVEFTLNSGLERIDTDEKQLQNNMDDDNDDDENADTDEDKAPTHKPSLNRLCELQLQGDHIASVIAYVSGSDMFLTQTQQQQHQVRPQTLLDSALANCSQRLLITIHKAKSVEDSLLQVLKAKPHSLVLADVTKQLETLENLPVWLPIINDVKRVCKQAQTAQEHFDVMEKLLVSKSYDPDWDPDSLPDGLYDGLGLGTLDCTPTKWKAYFDSIEDDIKDCVISFPSLDRVRSLLTNITECHNRLTELFVRPNTNKSLLEILLPRSASALDLLIRLDSGVDPGSNSTISTDPDAKTTVTGRRYGRNSGSRSSTYQTMCKENAKEFAKTLIKCTDPSRVYESMYRGFVESEINCIQRLRNTNMKKSRAKNQDNIAYCICRQPGFNGFMVQCELCRDWVHGRCVALPSLRESETERMRYLCPRCECSMRPDLNQLLGVLSDLNNLLSNDESKDPSSRRRMCLLQLPDMVAAQLLCERAFLFIQHLRSVIVSNPELHESITEYEHFSRMKMPLFDCSEDEPSQTPNEGSDNLDEQQKGFTRPLVDVEQSNDSSKMIMKTSKSLSYHWTSTMKPPPSLVSKSSSSLAGSSRTVSLSEMDGSEDMHLDTSDPHFLMRKQMRKAPLFMRSDDTSAPPMLGGQVKETEAAEALADMSAMPSRSHPNLNAASHRFYDANTRRLTPDLETRIDRSTDSKRSLLNQKGSADSSPVRSRFGSSSSSTAYRPNRLDPFMRGVHGNTKRLNSGRHPISRPRLDDSPSSRYLVDSIQKRPGRLGMMKSKSHMNSSVPMAQPPQAQKFFFELSMEARAVLENLIMEACLLEVNLPHTRWLWQLHLASDPETSSGGAYRPRLAKIEEDRLKQRIRRYSNHTRSSTQRARPGRRKRSPSEERTLDDDATAEPSNAHAESPNSANEQEPSRKRRSGSYAQSEVSSQSSASISADRAGRVGRRKATRARGRASTTIRTRSNYALGRPRRLHSLRSRRPMQRSIRALGFRSLRMSSDLSNSLVPVARQKRIVSTLNRKYAGLDEDSRSRYLNLSWPDFANRHGAAPKRMGRVFRGESRIGRRPYLESNDDQSYSSSTEDDNNEQLPRGSETKPRQPGPSNAPTSRGRGQSSKRGQTARRSMVKKSRNDFGDADQSSTVNEDDCAARPCHNPRTGTVEWIACDGCERWFHQICVGIKNKVQVPRVFICLLCQRRSQLAARRKAAAAAIDSNNSNRIGRFYGSSSGSMGASHKIRRYFRSVPIKFNSRVGQRPVGWSASAYERRTAKQYPPRPLDDFDEQEEDENDSDDDDDDDESNGHPSSMSHPNMTSKLNAASHPRAGWNRTSPDPSFPSSSYSTSQPYENSKHLPSVTNPKTFVNETKGPTELLWEAIEVVSASTSANAPNSSAHLDQPHTPDS